MDDQLRAWFLGNELDLDFYMLDFWIEFHRASLKIVADI